jgi:uncharacterized membrane protein
LSTTKMTKVEMAVIIGIFTCWAMPMAIYTKALTSSKGDTFQTAFACYTNLPLDISSAYELTHTIICQILPLVLLVIFNCLISITLHRRNEKNIVASAKQTTEEKGIISMVLTVTIVFMVCIFPYVVVVCVFEISDRRMDVFQMKILLFVSKLSGFIYAINTSINLYLYCICSRKFRDDFKAVILCHCLRRKYK